MKPFQLHVWIFLTWAFLVPATGFCDGCETANAKYREAVRSQDYARKIALYREAVRLCPDHAKAHNNLADALEKTGDYDGAIREYEAALGIDPGLAYAHFGLGDTCVKIGLYRKAVEHYRAGLRYIPDDELATQGLAVAESKAKESRENRGVVSSDRIVASLKEPSVRLMGPGGVRERAARVRFDNILFAVDSAQIEPSSYPQLDEIGKALRSPELQGRRFRIEGHTDSDGSESYNLELSENRARSVLGYLADKYDLSRKKFEVRGYGESRPVSDNTTPEAKTLNRRVEIVAFSGDR